jgi:ABC-type amino acid transport substrate-binding protein
MFPPKESKKQESGQASVSKIDDLSLVKCDGGSVAQKSKNILKVGVVRDQLPFTAMRDHIPVGFEVDLMHLLAQEEEIDFNFFPINMAEIDEKIKQSAIDIILGGWPNVQSNSDYSWSDGYLNTDIVVVCLKKSKIDVPKFSFTGKHIGVVKGSAFEHYIRKANIQTTKITCFESNGDLLECLLKNNKRLENGENTAPIDMALTDYHMARDWIAKNPELKLLPLNMKCEIVVLSKKDIPELTRINQGFKKLVGSQKFSEIMRRWGIQSI